MNQTPTFEIVVAPCSNDRGGNEIASSLRSFAMTERESFLKYLLQLEKKWGKIGS